MIRRAVRTGERGCAALLRGERTCDGQHRQQQGEQEANHRHGPFVKKIHIPDLECIFPYRIDPAQGAAERRSL